MFNIKVAERKKKRIHKKYPFLYKLHAYTTDLIHSSVDKQNWWASSVNKAVEEVNSKIPITLRLVKSSRAGAQKKASPAGF